METSRIEDAILSVVEGRWTKVALVISKVAASMGNLPTIDEEGKVISEHIERLIRAGRLEGRGDTNNWRFSEVRLSDPKASRVSGQ